MESPRLLFPRRRRAGRGLCGRAASPTLWGHDLKLVLAARIVREQSDAPHGGMT